MPGKGKDPEEGEEVPRKGAYATGGKICLYRPVAVYMVFARTKHKKGQRKFWGIPLKGTLIAI